MGPLQAIPRCLRHYVTVSGRARRPEFWWFFALAAVLTALSPPLDGLLGTATPVGGVLQSLVPFALAPPVLSAAWRRMHDVDRPGWYALLPLAGMMGMAMALMFIFPGDEFGMGGIDTRGKGFFVLTSAAGLIGLAVALVFLVLPGTRGPNRFGPEPPA